MGRGVWDLGISLGRKHVKKHQGGRIKENIFKLPNRKKQKWKEKYY